MDHSFKSDALGVIFPLPFGRWTISGDELSPCMLSIVSPLFILIITVRKETHSMSIMPIDWSIWRCEVSSTTLLIIVRLIEPIKVIESHHSDHLSSRLFLSIRICSIPSISWEGIQCCFSDDSSAECCRSLWIVFENQFESNFCQWSDGEILRLGMIDGFVQSSNIVCFFSFFSFFVAEESLRMMMDKSTSAVTWANFG